MYRFRLSFRVNPPPRDRSAFTLVEMLVVISVIGILAAIALPAINAAREAARQSECQNNLRQFGIALQANGTNGGRICSGAFDWLRDGCVTEKSWVADLVNSGTLVGKMLCVSNPSKGSQTLNDLINADNSTANFDSCVSHSGSSPKALPNGSYVSNPCRQIISGGMAAGSETRIALVKDRIVDKHFNTNYTASWYLVRGEPVLDASGNLGQIKAGCGTDIKSLNSCKGPITLSDLSAGSVAAGMVPLLADGTEVTQLTANIGHLKQGTGLVASLTNGPVLVSTMAVPTFAANTPRNGPAGWWNTWATLTLQDYRGFAPVHRGVVNVLFADMSVRTIKDENQDELINNGFPAINGFSDSMVEVSPNDFQSRYNMKRAPQ